MKRACRWLNRHLTQVCLVLAVIGLARSFHRNGASLLWVGIVMLWLIVWALERENERLRTNAQRVATSAERLLKVIDESGGSISATLTRVRERRSEQ